MKSAKQPEEPATSLEQPVPEPEPDTNGNGASRIVRNQSISIKGSLKDVAVQPQEESSTTLPEEAASASEQTITGEVDPDQILKAWSDYAASVERRNPRVFSTLQSNRPVVKADGTIQVLLNSEAQRDNFLKNIRSDLVRFIRETTGIDQVEILAEVVEMEQNGKKIYTDHDKLDFLIKKNPELGNLKSKFNLDFDD